MSLARSPSATLWCQAAWQQRVHTVVVTTARDWQLAGWLALTNPPSPVAAPANPHTPTGNRPPFARGPRVALGHLITDPPDPRHELSATSIRP